MPLRRLCSFFAALSLSVLLTSLDVRAAEPRSSVQGRPTGSLGAHLDAEGYLSLPDGFSGNLDPTGFRLVSSTGEAPRFASIAASTRPSGWIPFGGLTNGCNGTVLAFAVGPGGEIYLGGSFSLCGDAVANHIVRYDPASGEWSALGHDGGNGVNSTVSAILVTDAGLYVGGRFTMANMGAEIGAAYVAHWDGSRWNPLGAGASGQISGSIYVSALAMLGNDLYVGGRFTHAGGQPANSIARWDGQSWSPLSSGGAVGITGEVFALAVHGGRLFVAGSVSLAGAGASPDARGIASWDGAQWTTFGNPAGSGIPRIRSLIVLEDAIFVAGLFYGPDGISPPDLNHIARWDGQQWRALGTGAGNGVDGEVRSMAMIDGVLHVGGDFLNANEGQPIAASGVARWDGVQWSALPGQGGEGVGGTELQPPNVRVLVPHAGELFVGGGFLRVNSGAPLSAHRIARWRDQRWSRFGEGDGLGTNDWIRAVAVDGSDVYVGGHFREVGGIAANRIARWDGEHWSALGSAGGNGVTGSVGVTVNALALAENGLYVGGRFSEANAGAGILAPNIAFWDFEAQTWTALQGSEAGGIGDYETVALALGGGHLYAADRGRVSRWDGEDWTVLEGHLRGPNSTQLRALAYFQGEVYVGGTFDAIYLGSQDFPGTRSIARWSGHEWVAVGSGGGGGVDYEGYTGSVYALLARGNQLYVGGSFNRVNIGSPVDAHGIARWDGTAWWALGSGSELLMNVRALASDGNSLYATGLYSPPAAGGWSFGRAVARWDGRGWAAVGRGFNGLWDRQLHHVELSALATAGDGLVFVGGHFAGVGGQASANIAVYVDERIFDDGFDSRVAIGASGASGD